MGIVRVLEQKLVNFLGAEVKVDAPTPDEETEEQQLLCRAEIQLAIDDMQRHERIMWRD